MHYKNGREAKQGDKVINLPSGRTGIVHSLTEGSSTCNGRLVPTNENDAYITLSECLHIDDIKAADIPDSSRIAATMS